jgi:hypothetical protein
VSFETVNFRCPQQRAKQKMQAKHSTTEGRHDGIGIPSATRPFAVVNKNKQTKQKTKHMKIIKHLTFGALAVLAVTLLFQTPTTRADDHSQKENRDHRDAIITWTKHITAFLPPGGEIFATIAGTAGGDIGDGTLVGEALNPRELLPGGFVTFEADYHFIGSKHSLTVHFRTVQGKDPNGVTRGVITGFVKDGWLKGNVVVGEYEGYACAEGTGVCFDGTFVIKKGTKNKD